MHLHLICVGRLKAGPERELVCHYLARAAALGKSLSVSDFDMREIEESKARRAADRKSDEAKAIRAVLADYPDRRTIVCDEAGDMVSSTSFADKIRTWRDTSIAHIVLIIGGPDGLDPSLAAEADLKLAFGRLTWPHQLARIMAAEQLYRALTLIAGHPYHRA